MKRTHLKTRLVFFLTVIAMVSITPSVFAKADSTRAHKIKKTKSSESIQSEAGLNIPEWGIAIDAFFDPRLTDLIPGYHIVNIVLTNRRNGPITLSPDEDKWSIVDGIGKKHAARNHVRVFNEKLWRDLPTSLKERLDYPQIVKPGNFTTVDVFVPKSVDLFKFREVLWKSKYFNKEFSILTNYEDSLNIDEGKQHPLPKNTRTQNYTDEDYLKTRDEVLGASKWKKQDEKPNESDTNATTFDPSFDDAIIMR